MPAFNAPKHLEIIRTELDRLFQHYHTTGEPVTVKECLILEDICSAIRPLRNATIRADLRLGVDVRSVSLKHGLSEGRISQIKRVDIAPIRWKMPRQPR